MVTLVKELQFLKAQLPTRVTPSATVTFSKELELANQPARIGFWLAKAGMVILLKESQNSKAQNPMYLAELGMVMAVNELHFMKAQAPMWVTESGMVTLAKELHP